VLALAGRVVEASIAIRRPDCPLILLTSTLSLRPKFYNIAVSESLVRHVVEFEEGDLERFLDASRGLLRVRVVDRRSGLLWVENPMPCSFCRALSSLKGLPLALNLDSTGAPVYRVIMPSKTALTRLISRLKANHLEPELLKAAGRPRIARLTRGQVRALIVAYEYGFFDYPKRVTLERLAQILGVKPATLDETLRRAVKKLVEEYLRHHLAI